MQVSSLQKPEKSKLKELYILLNTVRGTVPLNRDLGLDPRLLDKPLHTIAKTIEFEVKRQVKKYITGLTVGNVYCRSVDTGIEIICEVEIDG